MLPTHRMLYVLRRCGLSLPVLIAGLVVCGAVVGCRSATGADNKADLRISGTITSAEDGTPLPGIVVEVWTAGSWWSGTSGRLRARSTSGLDGAYSLETGSVGCANVVLQAAWDPGDGYETAELGNIYSDTARFSQSVACTHEPQVIDINLVPDGTTPSGNS